jgi:hypothetical protein
MDRIIARFFASWLRDQGCGCVLPITLLIVTAGFVVFAFVC